MDGGLFHFWQGMTIGFLVYTVATAVFSVLLLVYFEIITEALSSYKIAAIEFLNAKKELYLEEFGTDEFQSQIAAIEEISSFDLVLSATLKKLLAGFFITPVISIILRKQPK